MEKGKVVVMRRGRRVHFTGFRYLLNFFLVSEFWPIFERRNKISSENLMQSEIRLHKSKFVVSSLFCQPKSKQINFRVFFSTFTFSSLLRSLKGACASPSPPPQVLKFFSVRLLTANFILFVWLFYHWPRIVIWWVFFDTTDIYTVPKFMEIDVVRQQQRMDHDAIGRCHLWSPKKTCSQCKKKTRTRRNDHHYTRALVGWVDLEEQ